MAATARDINSVIIYGFAGVGKSYEVARAMSKALWVVTRKSNLNAYHDFIKKCPEEAAKQGLERVPDNRIVQVPSMIVNRETGEMEQTNTMEFIDDLLRMYCKMVVTGGLDCDGIVFDEFSVFLKRIYAEMKRANSNGFEVIENIKSWARKVCEVPVATDKPMILICHANDPKYGEDGALKYRGGPSAPIGTMIAEMCALPDAVLQMVVKTDAVGGKTKRLFLTQAHPEWERKCRLWDIDPEIPADLRALLQQGGWD